jgi:putative spermidine/putrescine transport system ATP-binding protein
VFNKGRIEQLAAPRELYLRPATAFVARFVGSANVAEGDLAQRLSGSARPFAIRAENIHLRSIDEPIADALQRCEGTLLDVQYHGAMSRCQVELAAGVVFAATVAERGGELPAIGSRVTLTWSPQDCVPLASGASAS